MCHHQNITIFRDVFGVGVAHELVIKALLLVVGTEVLDIPSQWSWCDMY